MLASEGHFCLKRDTFVLVETFLSISDQSLGKNRHFLPGPLNAGYKVNLVEHVVQQGLVVRREGQ